MNDPIIWQILLQVLLIALNAVFACAAGVAAHRLNRTELALRMC